MPAHRFFLLLVFILSCIAPAARADLFALSLDLAGNAPDRSAGTSAAAQTADRLEEQARQAILGTGGQVFRQRFFITVPVVDVCQLRPLASSSTQAATWAASTSLPVAPLEPMGGQPPALGEPGKPRELDVLYGRGGRLADLRGKPLANRVIALDIDDPESAAGWQRCAAQGAAGVVFLGDPDTRAPDFLSKATTLPLALPRFYCDDPAAVAWFRSAAESPRRLSAELRVHWEQRPADNILCTIPGTAGSGDWTSQWIILQSRYDGVSPVMTRAPGATTAANSAILLDLASRIAASRAHCGAVLAWTAGDQWNNRGTRAVLDLVARGLRSPTQAISRLQTRRSEAQHALARAQSLAENLQSFARQGWPASPAPEPMQAVPQAIEDELFRQQSLLEDQLQRARLSGSPPASLQPLQDQKRDLVLAQNIVHGRSDSAPTAAQRSLIQDATKNAASLWQGEAARRRQESDAFGNWPDIRAAMPQRDPLLFISLAFSAGSDRPLNFGLLSRSFYTAGGGGGGIDATGAMSSFAHSFRRYGADDPAFFAESTENTYALEAMLPVRRGFCSDAAIADGQPAAAAATLLDPDSRFDLPGDTIEQIHFPSLARQEEGLVQLLLGKATATGILTDPLFYGRADLQPQISDQDLTIYEFSAGEALPRLRAANVLVGGESETWNHPLGDPLAGTRRTEWYLTHADGTVHIPSAGRIQESELRLQAFAFNDRGQAVKTLSATDADIHGMVASVYPNANRPVRAMLFNCARLDVYGLFDPRFLDQLDHLQLLDARRTDAAQFSNIYARDGLAAVFMPGFNGQPDIRWQLLASRGNINNRLILTGADAQHPLGQGYDTTSLAQLGPLDWRGAQDFAFLNAQRKADLEKFGISNEIIRELQSASDKQLALARAAQQNRDYPTFYAATSALWSLQSQEYQALIDTSNGIIKGVIFLLLGVIPFSYFLERLLIGASSVYRQIAGFAIIFVLMTAGLWFHPAFRISSAPLMILLAFLILILSTTVVYILWGKFEEEISRLRGTSGNHSHVASLRRGAVVGAAIRLGLSNMRRRGMRTALTLTTLVLLTFTLLCFTSVRETVQISPHPVDYFQSPAHPSPPAGILLRQRGWQELPTQSIELARSLALPPAIALGESLPNAHLAPGPVATRWWYASQRAEQPWLLPVQSANSVNPYFVAGLLGLEPAESEFQPPPAPADNLPLPQADSCWLPTAARDALHLQPGDTITIMGYSLRVAGFFSAESFARLRQLTGDPLSPLEPAASGVASSNQPSFRPETSYRFLDAISTAIVPAWVTQELGGHLTSIMLRPATIPPRPSATEASTLTQVATSLARRSAFTIYVSTGEPNTPAPVLSINSAEASRPQDLGTVLVPMIIAGVIVLNTMLGAVSERTREIHVYTSVGLSPAHVGMLFLAEAAALGTLGVVFGYIFGQGLATILSWTHWLPGVDLNYSSLSAIVTMGLVLGIVMLSALWPARAASRLAAPSLQRRWKLPRPVGDLLAVDLPFTVNETAAQGVCAFLAEFLQSTSHAGTGRFTADSVHPFLRPTTLNDGTVVRGLIARIWLAPYDLGVIQSMQLSIHPTDQPSVFDVHVKLTREAGNPSTWRRLNRPFLIEIRKQFLLWRSLDPQRVQHYVQRSATLFQTPPEAPR